ncbi:snRNA-activating protein complex subunit 1 isoform X2 [Chelonia mydas]|uniref:snRNA-activating protein complex subunit 1 isoform X2 n=1 Tax=Chelonia mydas TaxID=8469 RepID=UPI0018A23EA4|nr:snRNA-activating protein complex subunit 1 isoform X2 [Chelonia mydas]
MSASRCSPACGGTAASTPSSSETPGSLPPPPREGSGFVPAPLVRDPAPTRTPPPGQTRPLEKNKFTQKVLDLAWRYFLPPYTFQIRVGALYLLYGLYSTQLCKPKQKIRVALKEWLEVQRFQQDLINAQHYDAAYIFRKLRLDKAFHFTAMPRLLCFRTKKKIRETELKEEFKELSNRVSRLITNDVLEEMMNVHDHYQKMKCLISTDGSQPDKALSLIKDEFVINIKNMILEYQQWQQDKMKSSSKAKDSDEMTDKKEGGTSQDSEGSERANALAKIKYKSYNAVAEASKSRRHRQVKLESSESGSDQGKMKTPRCTRSRERSQLTQKRNSLETKDRRQAIKKEAVTRNRRMPVIAEEENSSEEDLPCPKRKRTR